MIRMKNRDRTTMSAGVKISINRDIPLQNRSPRRMIIDEFDRMMNSTSMK